MENLNICMVYIFLLQGRGLVASMSSYKTRGPGSIPGLAHIYSVPFLPFLNILMLNYFIQVKRHHQNDRNGKS